MYVLDTNVLIEAKNRYYAFDLAPGFWDWLEQAHTSAQVVSIGAVRDELLEGANELADWATANDRFSRTLMKAPHGTSERSPHGPSPAITPQPPWRTSPVPMRISSSSPMPGSTNTLWSHMNALDLNRETES